MSGTGRGTGASAAGGEPHDGVAGGDAITIDCDECTMQGTHACDDCVVTFICSRAPNDAVVIDAAEARAMRTMAEVGLAPPLRHRPRTTTTTTALG
jgi:hypothetical protein